METRYISCFIKDKTKESLNNFINFEPSNCYNLIDIKIFMGIHFTIINFGAIIIINSFSNQNYLALLVYLGNHFYDMIRFLVSTKPSKLFTFLIEINFI
jgi:hypothetical protein